MAEHHERLLADLERDGPEPLRAHLADGRASVAGTVRAGLNETDPRERLVRRSAGAPGPG